MISTCWKLPLVDARFWFAVSKVASESGEAAFVAHAKSKNNFILKKYFIVTNYLVIKNLIFRKLSLFKYLLLLIGCQLLSTIIFVVSTFSQQQTKSTIGIARGTFWQEWRQISSDDVTILRKGSSRNSVLFQLNEVYTSLQMKVNSMNYSL